MNSTRKGRKHPANLREQVDDEVMAFWRTPTAAEAMRVKFDEKHIMNSARKGHVNITSQALYSKLWFTPTASEGKRTEFSKEALKKSKGKGGLSQEIAHNDTGKGGLNPLWVEQLMGFPVGWTEVCSAEN